MKNLRAFVSPGKYIQGKDSISLLDSLIPEYGGRALIVIDAFLYEQLSNKTRIILEDSNIDCTFEKFSGEADDAAIKQLGAVAGKLNKTVIIGMGGGKTLDTVKAVGDETGCHVIVVPTTASTDAPCSSLAIIYNSDAVREVRKCRKNPDLVLVDSDIIVNAPIRFFVAGIGDAIATYPEARAASISGGKNFIGENIISAQLSLCISKACWDIVTANAIQAYKDISEKKCTDSVENIIEANILLSGLGFENSGCACAHSISKGLSSVAACKNLLHGEKVAFGALCQLTAEKQFAELDLLQSIYYQIGLPLTLEDMGAESNRENIRSIAVNSLNDTFWENEPFSVNGEIIEDIIQRTEELGLLYRSGRRR
jgi:glycerol dehydrogenase